MLYGYFKNSVVPTPIFEVIDSSAFNNSALLFIVTIPELCVIKSELKPILENLISEWGPDAPQWRTFLKSVGENGYPKGYQPGSMVDHKELFPRLDEEGLSVGFSFNMENSELKDLLKGL